MGWAGCESDPANSVYHALQMFTPPLRPGLTFLS